MKTIISEIAKNCQWHKTAKPEYKLIAEERIEQLEKELPSGSGIDSGCRILIPESGEKRVVISFSYHHMKDGYYTGWTNHKLIVTPNLVNDYDMRITGKDRDFLKDYLYDTFGHILDQPAPEFTNA